MDKYKKLISNTVIFAIGTFGAKALTFLMMPLFALTFSPSEMGVANLTVQMGNLLLPVVSVGIVNGIIRFGLDRNVRKSDVFTTGLVAIFAGWGLWLLVEPLILPLLAPVLAQMGMDAEFVSKNLNLLNVFVLVSSLRSLCSVFVRARGLVRLFAINGVISTATLVIAYVVFLQVIPMGATGYLLAIVCSDALSVLFLCIMAGLPKYLRFKGVNLSTSRDMLKYSIPMIPNTIFWWITNISSQFLISYMLTKADSGLFKTANIAPGLIIVVSSFFMDAWQMSAVTEEKARARFFTKVFKVYSSIIFLMAALVIPFSKVVMQILTFTNDAYYEAWRYIPFLIMATVFTCFVNFLGSIYMTEKKSMNSLATAAVGAVCNVALSLLLIPPMGVNGAGAAMMLSYIIVFIVRTVDCERYIKMRWSRLRMVVNTLLLGAQCVVMVWELPLWILWETAITVLIFLLNYREVLEGVKKMIPERLKNRFTRTKKA